MPQGALWRLCRPEREVAASAARAQANKRIADELGVSLSAVGSTLRVIRRKLGLRFPVQLIALRALADAR